MSKNRDFPKFYRHTNKPDSDALFVRFDNAEDDCVVITTLGRERVPNASPWPWAFCVVLEEAGMAVQIDAEEAKRLRQQALQAATFGLV